MESFSDRLAKAIQLRKNPVVVGLDPRFRQLPEAIQPAEETPESVASAYRQFCCEIIDVVAELVPAVKPQMAFFEALGPAGMAALFDVVAYARACLAHRRIRTAGGVSHI